MKDAPFTRMDLISCRNLLIFLSPTAKTRLLTLFQIALKKRGLLFLGSAENIEFECQLFETDDRENHIYRRRNRKVPVGQYADSPLLLDGETRSDGLDPMARLAQFVVIRTEDKSRSTTEVGASNQELQVINQELRSVTEELEVNRQELQSINEELSV